MGSKGNNVSTTSTSPPPQVSSAVNQALSQAQAAAAKPYQGYAGQQVADMNGTQNSAIQQISNNSNLAQGYDNAATGLAAAGTNAATPTQFSPAGLSQYSNPYTNQVINSTMALANQQDAQQQSALQGNAISQGAFGGDRAGVAQAALMGQQALANNSTIANLQNSNYNQALSEFNNQQQTGLSAQENNLSRDLSGASLIGNIGTQAQNSALTGAQSELAAGNQQQQQQQNLLNTDYTNWQQQQAYPYQQAQYLSGIAGSLAGADGYTSTSSTPGQSNTSAVLGDVGSIAAVAALAGMKRGGSVQGYDDGGYVGSDLFSGSPVFTTDSSPAIGAPSMTNADNAANSSDFFLSSAPDSAWSGSGSGTDYAGIAKAAGSLGGSGKSDAPRAPSAPAPHGSGSSAVVIPGITAATNLPGFITPSSHLVQNSGVSGGIAALARGGVHAYATDGTVQPDDSASTDSSSPGILSTVGNWFGGLLPSGSDSSSSSNPPSNASLNMPSQSSQSSGPANASWAIPLLAASLATMSGQSHNAAANIGAGGLAGLQTYQGMKAAQVAQQEEQAKQALQQQQADQTAQYQTGQLQQQKLNAANEAQRLANETTRIKQMDPYYQALTGEAKARTANAGQDSDTPDTPDYDFKPGMGADPKTGAQVAGAWKVGSDGSSAFVPGMVMGATGAANPAAAGLPSITNAGLAMASGYQEATKNNPLGSRMNPVANAMVEQRAQQFLSTLPAGADPNSPETLQALQQAGRDWGLKAQEGVTTQRTLNDAATGGIAKSGKAIDAAVSHIQLASQLVDAMGNGDVTALNDVNQKWQRMFGVPAPTNFDAVRNMLTEEATRAGMGGAGALADRLQNQGPLDNANGPAILHGALNQFMGLIGGQADALEQQYRSGTQGLDNFRGKIIEPSTVQALYGGPKIPGMGQLKYSPSEKAWYDPVNHKKVYYDLKKDGAVQVEDAK